MMVVASFCVPGNEKQGWPETGYGGNIYALIFHICQCKYEKSELLFWGKPVVKFTIRDHVSLGLLILL